MKNKKITKIEIKLNINEDKKLYAFIGAFFPIIGFIVVFLSRRKDDYAMFYAKQGLVLSIAALIGSAISQIPFIGWVLSPFLLIAWLILWIMTWFNSLSGKKIDTIIVGELAEKIDL